MITAVIISFISGFIVGGTIIGAAAVDFGMRIGREDDKK